MSKKLKIKKRKDLLSLLDFVFVLGTEDGTESFAYAFNENGGMMTVADSVSSGVPETSEGYRATRVATGTMDAEYWAVSNAKKALDDAFLPSFTEKFSFALHKNLKEAFDTIPPISCGSFFMQCENKKFVTGYFGCGSIRLFLLTENGLLILSPEKFSTILSGKMFSCPLPAILLCVSDRTFQKFESPMDFEYVLLDTLGDSQTVEGWKTLLTKRILAENDDSFLLLAAAFGFGSFKSLQKLFSNRKSNLYWNFLSKETNATPYEIEAMAKTYNDGYRLLQQGNLIPEASDEEKSPVKEDGDEI